MPTSPSVQNRTSRLPFVSDGFMFKEHVRRYNNMQRVMQERFGKPAQYISGIDGSLAVSSPGRSGRYLGSPPRTATGGRSAQGAGDYGGYMVPLRPQSRQQVETDDELMRYLVDRHQMDPRNADYQPAQSYKPNYSRSSLSELRASGEPDAAVKLSANSQAPDDAAYMAPGNALVLTGSASAQVGDGPMPGRQRPKRRTGGFLGDEATLVADLEDLFQGLQAIRNPQLANMGNSVGVLSQSFVESNSIVKRVYRKYHMSLDITEDIINRVDEYLCTTNDQQTLAAAKRAIVKIHRGMNSDSALEVFMAECHDNYLSQALTAMILQVL